MTALPPLYIINLPQDHERRARMEERLAPLGLSYEFIEGVDGRALLVDDYPHYDRKKRLRYFGRDLQPGEIGCLLSHRKIYQKIVAENTPYAVILEDDVIFEEGFTDVLAALMACPEKWDMIRFLGSEKIYKRGCRKIMPLTGKYWLARLPTTPGGGHGYLLSLQAARNMLALMDRNWIPIDALQGRSWETGLETLVVHPAPLYPHEAYAENAVSTIGDARFDKTIRLTGIRKMLFPLFRSYFKLSEMAGKKYTYLSSWRRDKKAGQNG